MGTITKRKCGFYNFHTVTSPDHADGGAEYHRRGGHLAFSTRLPPQRDSVRCHPTGRMDTLQTSPSDQSRCRGI